MGTAARLDGEEKGGWGERTQRGQEMLGGRIRASSKSLSVNGSCVGTILFSAYPRGLGTFDTSGRPLMEHPGCLTRP